MPTLRIAFAASALTLFAPFAAAQMRPLPGMPMVPPPVPQPTLGAQPWFNHDNAASSGSTSTPQPASGAMPANMPQPPAPPKPPAETMGPKIEGKDLKKAVGKVKALKWLDDLAEAKAQCAATGKPILWLQALGDIDGFA
jgi:hypothetical protein